jgi:hypothetical protein
MNERIDKLMVKAGAYFGGEGVVYDTFDPKKFAELIVRECMKLNSKELSITAIERLLPLYEEHFGVEE